MARNGKIRRAPGFEDRAGNDLERVDAAVRTSRDVLYARGYEPIETPLIEQTELFLRRSGGLLSSQLFDFAAPDGSGITLRPELTAPVVRHALERADRMLPMRFQYAAPIFRYTERPYDAPATTQPSKRQFTQVGAELVGSSQPHSDGEIVEAAYTLAMRLGIESIAIRIGHVGLIRDILDGFRLSERARLFLADSVSELAKGDEARSKVESEAARLGLMPSEGQQNIETQASAADLLSRLATGSVRLPTSTETTSRSAEEIVAGLRRKVEWDASNVDFPEALSIIAKVSQLNGLVTTAGDLEILEPVQRLIDEFDLQCADSLEDLMSVTKMATSSGADGWDMCVDLGFSASFAYYSGMIFEVTTVAGGETVVLGGGGRYDGLASALGSEEPLPALGFALNLDTILELASNDESSEPKRRYIVLAPSNAGNVDQVVKQSAKLRWRGENVVSVFDCEADAEAIAAYIGNAEVVRVGLETSAKDDVE